MADISDVEQAFANAITSILYPYGTSQSSIVGVLCRIYRGWPNSSTLNSDLNNGNVNVTVVTDNQSGQITTRYLPEWQMLPAQAGVAVSTVGETIMFSGTPSVGDVVGVLIDGISYAYRVLMGDTSELAASNLCQLIQFVRPATTEGYTIDVPGSSSIQVRVVCDNLASLENRRQENDLRVICWCPAPTVRDAAASAIDAAINGISFLKLQDNTDVRVIYKDTASYDQSQNALLYRRDLVYTVEYPTIATFELPAMLFGASGINGNIIYG